MAGRETERVRKREREKERGDQREEERVEGPLDPLKVLSGDKGKSDAFLIVTIPPSPRHRHVFFPNSRVRYKYLQLTLFRGECEEWLCITVRQGRVVGSGNH